jgi:hypothetical protein
MCSCEDRIQYFVYVISLFITFLINQLITDVKVLLYQVTSYVAYVLCMLVFSVTFKHERM